MATFQLLLISTSNNQKYIYVYANKFWLSLTCGYIQDIMSVTKFRCVTQFCCDLSSSVKTIVHLNIIRNF